MNKSERFTTNRPSPRPISIKGQVANIENIAQAIFDKWCEGK